MHNFMVSSDTFPLNALENDRFAFLFSHVFITRANPSFTRDIDDRSPIHTTTTTRR